jgi:hypothetical protein
MSPSIPPLFSPLLPRRRLCHCPSCIDAPAPITILLAAVCLCCPVRASFDATTATDRFP